MNLVKSSRSLRIDTRDLELNAGHLRLGICVAMMWHVRDQKNKNVGLSNYT
jgi:hypothetical protein